MAAQSGLRQDRIQGLREQILSNAAAAFPKITHDCLEALIPNTNPADTFDVAICSNKTGRLYQAVLIYGSVTNRKVAARGWFSFSPEKALEMLLNALCDILRETFKANEIRNCRNAWGGTVDRSLLGGAYKCVDEDEVRFERRARKVKRRKQARRRRSGESEPGLKLETI